MRTIGKTLATAVLFAGVLEVVNAQGKLRMLAGDVALAAEGQAPQAAVEGLASRFGRHYVPVKVEVKPAIPAYGLPLAKAQVGNYDYVLGKLPNRASLDEQLLRRNGFAAARWWHGEEDFVAAYKNLRDMEVPVYVTSDSVLHLYHIHFDETLKRIEQVEFIPKLIALSKAIVEHLKLERMRANGEDAKAAIDKAMAFYAVGYEMLLDYSEEAEALKKYRQEVAGKPNWSSWELNQLSATNEALHYSIVSAPEWQDRNNLLNPQRANWQQQKGVMLKFLDALIARQGKLTDRLDLPPHVRQWVEHDKVKAAEHKDFAESSIFNYREDFSQYVPRGHYTRGYDLKRYFNAMMWFGRLTFLVKGGEPHGPFAKYLVSHQEAKRQTIAACYLSRALTDLSVGGESAKDLWERIYGVTAFFVGLADDLTYTEYDLAFTKALGKDYQPEMLNDEKTYFKVKVELAKLRKPAIYSGTGESGTMSPAALAGVPSPEELDKVLDKTQGFRFMGQRFVPDSYAMGKLVFPTVNKYTGEKPAGQVFTCAGDMRVFPRGLDVMALLGSERAKVHLRDTCDSAYAGYDDAFDKLAKEYAEIKEPEGWNINLYWSWLYCLKGLLPQYPTGYQPYMTTPAWQDKQLVAALSSWSQLRHDTILYVKQSYTMTKTAFIPQPQDFPGYVEPVPEFYGRLLALNRLTAKVLAQMKVLDEATIKRLDETDKLLSRLLEIAQKELANKPLTKDDEQWIKHFDSSLKNACAGYNANAMKTTLVADVHTDQNTKQVLEEGTGYVSLVLVANRLADGSVGLAAGPVFSYYEFKHPMADRLTDEKWREMLRGSKDHLSEKKPEFVKSYFSGGATVDESPEAPHWRRPGVPQLPGRYPLRPLGPNSPGN